MRRLSGQGAEHQRLPARRSGRLLSPIPLHRRQSVSDGPAQAGGRCRRRQRLQRQHAIYHPLLRGAATTFGFFDLMLADPAVRPHRLCRREGSRFRRVAAQRLPSGTPMSPPPSRAVAPIPTSRPSAWKTSPPMRPRAARPLPSWQRRSSSRCRHRRADRAIVDRGDRQGRDRRPALAAGRVRRHRRGLSRRVRQSRALRAAGVLRKPRPILRRAEERRRAADENIDAIRRYGTPVLQQRVATEAARAALAGDRRRGRDRRLSRHPDACLLGAAGDSRPQMGADRQDRHLRGLRTDRQAAAAT